MTDTGADPNNGPETAQIDTTVAHVARVYDYLLDGQANFAVDRKAAQQAYAAWPGGLDGVRADARAHRAVLGRMVRHLVHEAGIRQFLDVGSGIPKQGNVHEVAQQAAPESRVVYVDYDPIVLAHAHALLKSAPDGATAYLCRDFRETDMILQEARDTLNFDQPVALMLFGIMHFFADGHDPNDIVARLMAPLPSGSYLALSHLADTAELRETFDALNQQMAESVYLRTDDQVTRFFDGLELVDPGIVELPHWRPNPDTENAGPLPMWCGLAQKSDPPAG